MKFKTLTNAHIGLRGEKVLKIGAFKFLCKRLLLEKPRLYLFDKRLRHTLVADIDLIFWRAKDIYFYTSQGKKISGEKIYHSALHFLLVNKFGSQLKGRPRFILLCETIASLSDYYFDLEILRLFGDSPSENFKAQERVRIAIEIWGENKASKNIPELMGSQSEKQSFSKYRNAINEMYRYFEYLSALAKKRHENEKIDITEIHKFLRRTQYGALFHQFQLGNNILYALLHGGTETADGKNAVEECLTLLNSAESFVDFAKLLDSSAMKVAARAA